MKIRANMLVQSVIFMRLRYYSLIDMRNLVMKVSGIVAHHVITKHHGRRVLIFIDKVSMILQSSHAHLAVNNLGRQEL